MSRRRPFAPGTRRGFLRGLGGVALALPFLEIFSSRRALAATAPQRYVFMFGGMSIGSHGLDKMAPASEGPLEGNLTTGLAPLGTFGVTQEVSLVSGLEIPVGATPPAGGRPFTFHSTSHQVIATGQRYAMDSFGELPGVSSDWVVANAIGAGTALPVLAYRAQPSFYRVDQAGTTDGRISARLNASGHLEQVTPIASPHVAYDALFGNFVVPDAEGSEEAQRLLALRKSVVDLVADDTQALAKRLGKADKLRLERHLSELRSLETQLEAMAPPGAGSCVIPDAAAYATDPPIGDAVDPSGSGDYNDNFTNGNSYSNEDKRAELMTDLIHMAFACDLSRVSSFMLTHAQCFMNMFPLLGHASDLHEISHGSIGGGTAVEAQNALADCAAWHVKHFARLVQKLRDTEDVDGGSLLDNTAMALAFEGGWGFDPSGGGNSSPHSTENMVMLVGGRAGGLHTTPGRHIKAPGVHPSAVLNTLMQAVGVDETLGEVSGHVDELIG